MTTTYKAKPAVSLYERKEGTNYRQVAKREDGVWFCRTLAFGGDRQIKAWHEIEAPQDINTYFNTGRRAMLPKKAA